MLPSIRLNGLLLFSSKLIHLLKKLIMTLLSKLPLVPLLLLLLILLPKLLMVP
jgi:hypothetical protein